MNTFNLIVSPFAEVDLKVAFEWYNLQKENLGNEFISEVDFTIKRIKINPLQFPIKQKDIRKAVLKRFPFTIYFVVNEKLITVFAIFHNSRNPVIWKKRTKE